ncbi:hypothetical protein [uncultured Selenomonas sp.]|uniref:hypothetical protein n=1 Tax=uncultured Selenomonas sp. TaxID=159275 RepID=UPI0028048E39|nr:hypothetical protein [uncultured Selenomonas sp.]
MAVLKAKLRANARYQKKAYDQLAIRLPKGERERFAEYADEQGISLAEYVRRACYHASGKGMMTESVAYAGWSVRTYDDWIIAERIDNGEEGWLAAPFTADHMAVLAGIEDEWSVTAPERTEEAIEALKSWDPIRHPARPGFAAYEEDGAMYFEDEMYRYRTKELIDPYLVGCDDDGGYYFFRNGLGITAPIDLLDLVIGEPEEL